MLKRSMLGKHKWSGIKLDSCIVTYCMDCKMQRTHHCVDVVRGGDDVLYVFLCDYCRFGGLYE